MPLSPPPSKTRSTSPSCPSVTAHVSDIPRHALPSTAGTTLCFAPQLWQWRRAMASAKGLVLRLDERLGACRAEGGSSGRMCDRSAAPCPRYLRGHGGVVVAAPE